MDRDDQDVIRDVVRRFLVEVITDPGQMTEKMLHRDLVVDEWQIGTEQGPSKDRAVLSNPRRPSSTSFAMVRAVKPLTPLAIANPVSVVLARSAKP